MKFQLRQMQKIFMAQDYSLRKNLKGVQIIRKKFKILLRHRNNKDKAYYKVFTLRPTIMLSNQVLANNV